MSLIDYAKNVYSQNGEDGIIEELLTSLDLTQGTMVEFGGWDGVYLSNVLHHWMHKDFNVISIESDTARSNDAKRAFESYDSYTCVHSMISSNGQDENSIDNILEREGVVPEELVLMCIDVDGEDYNIFKSIEKYRPIILIIEDSVEEHIKDIEASGYNLVIFNGNSILVRSDYDTGYERVDFRESYDYAQQFDYSYVGNDGEVLTDIYHIRNDYRQFCSDTLRDLRK
tara:strand:- start:1355 stop:2038 length:684 start_codon:yes stop_codon:yes gene_type:complete